MPAYLGSTLRGAFGHVFRAMACPGRIGEPCPIAQSCPYHLIFETAPPPDSQALRTHEEIPRPFVIAPITDGRWMEQGRRLLEPGEELSFHLTLIGRAQEFFPYFVVAFREIDRIGRKSWPAIPSAAGGAARSDSPPTGRRTVELRRIDSIDPLTGAATQVYDAAENLVRAGGKPLTLADCAAIPPPSSDRLTLEFLTQTRLKHEGGFTRIPEFHIVFRRLLGRLSSLARFHCGAPLKVDFKGLIERAAAVRLIDDQTRWVSWTRYSNRQHQRMQWEGIIGGAAYDFAAIPTQGACVRPGAKSTRSDLPEVNPFAGVDNQPARGHGKALPLFWKFLKFGEYAHVGHGTTFGLGKYAIGG